MVNANTQYSWVQYCLGSCTCGTVVLTFVLITKSTMVLVKMKRNAKIPYSSQGGGFYTDSFFCTRSVQNCNILLQIVIRFMYRYVFHNNSRIFCVDVMFA